MISALNMPIAALPTTQVSAPVAISAQAPLSFENLLTISAELINASPTPKEMEQPLPDIIIDPAEPCPAPTHLNCSSILAIMLPTTATEALQLGDTSGDDLASTDDIDLPLPIPVLPLSLPVDPETMLLALPNNTVPQSAKKKPETATQIAPFPKDILPSAGFAALATPQTSPANTSVASGNIFNATTQHIFANRQLDLARDHLWLEHLARDIVAAREVSGRVSFRLLPPQLGQLDVNILTSDAGLSVNMNASSEEAAKIVSAAHPRLVEELRVQGMRVISAEISHRDMAQHGNRHPQASAPPVPELAGSAADKITLAETTPPDGRFA